MVQIIVFLHALSFRKVAAVAKKLDEYKRKRNFKKTIEPEGISDGTGGRTAAAGDRPAGTGEKAAEPRNEAARPVDKAEKPGDSAAEYGKNAAAAEPGHRNAMSGDRPAEPGEKVADSGESPDMPWNKGETPRKHLRFVVQHHIASRDHYDFRLEWDGVLLSWAVPKGPSYNTADKRLAVQVEDHPLEYRNFEGTIPKGEYGGGTVMLWDEGYWEPQCDVDKGLGDGSLKFVLKGRRLRGRWVLVRLKGKEGKKGGKAENNWLLLKEKDEYAGDSDGISGYTTSVRTGRTMEEIEESGDAKISADRNPFDKTGVQLAKMTDRIPEGDQWLFELKYDGYRIIAYVEDGRVRLVSRNGNDYTKVFSSVAGSLVQWAAGRPMVLDGEMVVSDENGRTDFQALQSYMKNPGGKILTYIIFDLLALDGEDLRGRRLTERKEKLEMLMKDCPSNLYYSRHVAGNGKACFQAACEANMEGIIGKKADSVYSGTRNGDWIKVKCDTRQEFVIGGYSVSEKRKSGISSLLLGVYEGNDLIYAGRAGTGFTGRIMQELEEKFRGIARAESPFKQAPQAKKNEKIIWLEPVLVAEIKFAQWTDENLLRQASFKGLRTDVDPENVKRETESMDGPMPDMTEKTAENPADDEDGGNNRQEEKNGQMHEVSLEWRGKSIYVGGVKITNPDRVVFEEPLVKKIDVVQYYAKAAERMLPYTGNRILSVIRCNKGITQTCFFKKHPGAGSKGIVTIPLMNGSGEEKEYFYVKDAAGLIAEAQMGTVEFHTWASRADDPEKPDMMVFDLDPDDNMEPDRVRQGVKDLKSILDQLSLISFLKTSGGKGYHVVVPFEPSADWDTFSNFAKRIAGIMEQKWPDRYTSNIRKDKRKNRIFIDWIRNGRGATSVAPYSLRARTGAKVSMPITWDELDMVAPDGIGMADALNRIRDTDPWDGFYMIRQRLK